MKDLIKIIRNNITPFLLLGILVGFVYSFQEGIQRIKLISSYLNFSRINLNLFSIYIEALKEHIAPISLSLLLPVVFCLSAFHRAILGKVEKENFFVRKIIIPIKNFAEILAIALLGVLIGLSISSFIFDSYKISLLFLIFCIYPIAYLILLHLCINIIYIENGHIINKLPPRFASRFDGIFLLVMAFILLTFHRQIIDFIKWISIQLIGFS